MCAYLGFLVRGVLSSRRSQWPARSKPYVCGRLPVDTSGSNPTRGIDVCRECCVLSGRDLGDVLVTCPKDSYRLWCVVVCDLETS